MKAAIYARESSKDTEKAPDIKKQMMRGRAWASGNGHAMFLNVYEDNGFSGGSWTRPGLVQMLKDIKANRFELLILWNLDRLARDTHLFLWIWDQLLAKNIKVYSLTEGWIDMLTANGRFTNTVIAASNELFRRNIGDKVRKVYEMKKVKGEPWGRKSALNEETRMMIRKLKADNPDWSPGKIRSALGLSVSVSTVRRVLK